MEIVSYFSLKMPYNIHRSDFQFFNAMGIVIFNAVNFTIKNLFVISSNIFTKIV